MTYREEVDEVASALGRWKPLRDSVGAAANELVNELAKVVAERDAARETIAAQLAAGKALYEATQKLMAERDAARAEVDELQVSNSNLIAGMLQQDTLRQERDAARAELAEARRQRDELLDAAKLAIREIRPSTDCSMCHDSTWDHECDSEVNTTHVALSNAIKGTIAAKSPPPVPQRDELAELRIQRDELVARLLDWCRQGGRNLCPTPGSADTFGDGIRQAQRVVRNLIAAEQPKRDWPEDAADTDNGSYQCRCVTCGSAFTGHKRRVVCKACAEQSKPARGAP